MLTYLFLQVLLCVILTETITELVVKSEIFQKVRSTFSIMGEWFQKLIHCGHCFSVWVAFGVVFFTETRYPLTGESVLDTFLMALVVHRLSNYLHNFNDCWLDKYYNVQRVNTVKE